MIYSLWAPLAALVAIACMANFADGACVAGVVCLTDTIYAFCVSGTSVIGNYSCPTGQYCVQGKDYPCQESTTASSIIVTPPAECTGPNKYPAQNCNQYYECSSFLWWYNLNLLNCSAGQAFNSARWECVNDATCNADTGQYQTTTTPAPVTPPSECTSAGKYPAENCNQYYECESFLWWYNLNLHNCSSGEAFDGVQLTCVSNWSCNADTGQIEVTTELTTVTTIITPVTPPSDCTSAGKYPAETCNQYYECEPFLWWYNLNLHNCSSGEAFDSAQLVCVSNWSCNAETGQIEETTELTTVTTTITNADMSQNDTTTVTPTIPPVTPPSDCTSAGKYPAENCNQYYECEPFLWWYNLNLHNCSSGETFDSVQLTCVSNWSCNANTGQIEVTTEPTTVTIIITDADVSQNETTAVTPTIPPVVPPSDCTSAGKYPAEYCNQYYECEPFLWWYNLNLHNCSSGEAFDSVQLTCVINWSCNANTGQIEVTTEPTNVTITITDADVSQNGTTAVTPTIPPVTPPSSCTSAGKYPAENCYQYYECESFLWWYDLKLYNCSSGEAFDATNSTCVSNSSCNEDTGNIEVTTELPTITTTTVSGSQNV